MNQSIVLGFSVLAEIRALKTNKETQRMFCSEADFTGSETEKPVAFFEYRSICI